MWIYSYCHNKFHTQLSFPLQNSISQIGYQISLTPQLDHVSDFWKYPQKDFFVGGGGEGKGQASTDQKTACAWLKGEKLPG